MTKPHLLSDIGPRASRLREYQQSGPRARSPNQQPHECDACDVTPLELGIESAGSALVMALLRFGSAGEADEAPGSAQEIALTIRFTHARWIAPWLLCAFRGWLLFA
jgi:hypothetical protein